MKLKFNKKNEISQQYYGARTSKNQKYSIIGYDLGDYDKQYV